MINQRTLQGIGFLLLATAATLLFAAAWFFLLPNHYTIYADGQTIGVRGKFATVQDVLTAAGVQVAEADTIFPAPASSADPDVLIAVERAQAVQLRTENGNRTYWTHQPTLGGFLAEIRHPLANTDQIFADGRAVSPANLSNVPLPRAVEIGQFMTVIIYDGPNQRMVRTAQKTVGEALTEAGVGLLTADITQPSAGSLLQPNMEIHIQRAMPLTIQVDGQAIQTRSHHQNARDVLAEVGTVLIGADYTIPGPEIVLQPHDIIQVVRVTENFEVVDVPLAYESVLQPTEQLEIDQRTILQPGVAGILRQRIRVRYENGVEVSRVPDAEWVAREPQPEVVGYGTQIVVRLLETAEGPVEYWRVVKMRVTSYRPGTSGKEPDAADYGITASGVPAGYGVVAVDPRVVPFMSQVYVPGYGRALAGDTGGGVLGRWVDLGYSDDLATYVPWSGYINVYYLTPIPAPQKINYLLPTELP